MTATHSPLTVKLLNQTLELHSNGAVFWRENRTLFVADVHLGKDATFQAASIPVPSGASAATLNGLRQAIASTAPQQVCILGDFLHARTSLSDTVVQDLEVFWSEHCQIAFTLVEGNHDLTSRKRLREFPLEIVSSPFYLEPFWLVHDCETQWASASQLHRLNAMTNTSGTSSNSEAFALGGHVHPAVRISSGRANEKLPCFHQTTRWLTLPAFGKFTGTKVIHTDASDRVYAIAGDRVFDTTALMRAPLPKRR